MKAIRHRLLRPRYLWPLAVACGAAGLIHGRFRTPRDRPAATPANRPSTAETSNSRPAARSMGELVAAWSEASAAALTAHPVITITGRDSVRRTQAFRDLLDGMEQGNAAALYRILKSGDLVPSDQEWHDFMERWGHLDGPAATALIEGNEGLTIQGLLRGWARIDPAAARAWLDERMATGETAAWHAPARRGLILGWVHADAGAAADWLNDHRENAEYPEIAAAFADEVVEIDPANAMEWAGSVEGGWRKWAMERVGRRWLQEDRPAAIAALQAAGYDEEAIDGLILSPVEGVDMLDSAVPLDGLPGVTVVEE